MGLVGLVKLATGIVSAITAVVLFRLIPTLVAFPSPGQLADTNERLRAEIEAHKQALASLEAQVAARTGELSDLNARISVQAREAVHRSANLLSIVGSLTKQSAREHERTEDFIDTLMGRIRSLAMATSTVMRGSEEYSGDLFAVVREQLEPLMLAFPDRVTLSEGRIAIAPEAARQISLAVHELATNAQKYSLAENEAVRFAVDWAVSGHGEEQAFTFEWRETSSGVATSENRPEGEGFGLKLLTRIVPQMMRREATRTLDAGQLLYRLSAPASAVLADPGDHKSSQFAARLVDDTFGMS